MKVISSSFCPQYYNRWNVQWKNSKEIQETGNRKPRKRLGTGYPNATKSCTPRAVFPCLLLRCFMFYSYPSFFYRLVSSCPSSITGFLSYRAFFFWRFYFNVVRRVLVTVFQRCFLSIELPITFCFCSRHNKAVTLKHPQGGKLYQLIKRSVWKLEILSSIQAELETRLKHGQTKIKCFEFLRQLVFWRLKLNFYLRKRNETKRKTTTTNALSSIAVITVISGFDTQTRLTGHFQMYWPLSLVWMQL